MAATNQSSYPACELPGSVCERKWNYVIGNIEDRRPNEDRKFPGISEQMVELDDVTNESRHHYGFFNRIVKKSLSVSFSRSENFDIENLKEISNPLKHPMANLALKMVVFICFSVLTSTLITCMITKSMLEAAKPVAARNLTEIERLAIREETLVESLVNLDAYGLMGDDSTNETLRQQTRDIILKAINMTKEINRILSRLQHAESDSAANNVNLIGIDNLPVSFLLDRDLILSIEQAEFMLSVLKEKEKGNLHRIRKRGISGVFPLVSLPDPIIYDVVKGHTYVVVNMSLRDIKADIYDIVNMSLRDITSKTGLVFNPYDRRENRSQLDLVIQNCTDWIAEDEAISSFGLLTKDGKAVVHICGNSSTKGIIIHGVLHSLGVMHEHQRCDRDKFVEISDISKQLKNIDKLCDIISYITNGTNYNYRSVTHYPFPWLIPKMNYPLERIGGDKVTRSDAQSIYRAIKRNEFDECKFPAFDPCHHMAICKDTENGPPNCTCKNGYIGNGYEFGPLYEPLDSWLELNYSYPAPSGCIENLCNTNSAPKCVPVSEVCKYDLYGEAHCECAPNYHRINGECLDDLHFIAVVTKVLVNRIDLIPKCVYPWNLGPNGNCFQFISEVKDWNGASQHCNTIGGNLPVVLDETLSMWLMGALSKTWIGLRRGPGAGLRNWHWKWENGAELQWSNWRAGEPSSDDELCVEICCDNGEHFGKWNDENCEAQYRFACEKLPDKY